MQLLKWTLLTAVAVIGLAIALFVLLLLLPMRPFERALATVFNGETDLSSGSKYVVACTGFNCDDVLPQLPPASEIKCVQSMLGDSLQIMGPGACCRAQFGNLGSTEIHIYRQLFGFKIHLTEPRMRDIVGSLAQQASSE